MNPRPALSSSQTASHGFGRLVAQAALTSLCIGLLCASPRRAAAARPGAATQPALPPEVRTAFDDGLAGVEADIANLILKRPDTAASGMPQLDLAVDLRLVDRMFIEAATKESSDSQAADFLRVVQIEAAIADLDAVLKAAPGPVPPGRAAAMARIHQLTFDLAAGKGSMSGDQVALALGTAIMDIADPAPAAPRVISPSRPAYTPAPKVGPATAAPKRDAASLEAEISQANVSAALRNQLLNLDKQLAAAGPDADPRQTEEQLKLLVEAVDLVKGVQGITGMDAETRGRIENQLTEGMALLSDTRTRTAGAARVKALSNYRQILLRIGNLQISPEQRNQFAPAIAWAQKNVDQGARVLGLLERFAELTARYQALPPTAANAAPLLRQATEALRRQFEATRQDFVKDLADITAAGGPEALEGLLPELKDIALSLEIADEMPQTLETINSFRPRPYNAIERRVNTGFQLVASPDHSPARDEALSFLIDITRVARVAPLLSAQAMSDIPPAVAESYAGKSLGDFQAACKHLVTDLANDAANNRTLDADKLRQLMVARHLVRSLRAAAALEASLDKLPLLQRWADWNIDTDRLQALLAPYRDGLAATIQGVNAGSVQMMDQWKITYRRYHPLIALVTRDLAYADQCSAMPTGLAGDAAKLCTPLTDEPFGDERFASLAVWAWDQCGRNADPDGQGQVLDALSARLSHDGAVSTRDVDNPPLDMLPRPPAPAAAAPK